VFILAVSALLTLDPVWAGPACRVQGTSRAFLVNRWLDEPSRSESEITAFLELFPTSRDVVRTYKVKSSEGQLLLKDLPPLGNLRARFTRPEGVGLLEVGPNELGVAAVLAFHEMVHALDDTYATPALLLGAEGRPADRDAHMLKAERLAYSAQRKLIEDIVSAAPCAERYFLEHEKRGNLVVRELTDSEIAEAYVKRAE
jgi:hypothetical protein